MPRRKRIDQEGLIRMVESGVARKEIMKKFGYKNPSQLKLAYNNALINTGKMPEAKDDRGAKNNAASTISVNKWGSLIIPKALARTLGLQQGETFTAKKTKMGIQLRKAE